MEYSNWSGIVLVALTLAVSYILHTILRLICGSGYRNNGYGEDAHWNIWYLSTLIAAIASLNGFVYVLGVPADTNAVTLLTVILTIASLILVECTRENVMALRSGYRYKDYIHQL